jgi:hypothetical protein
MEKQILQWEFGVEKIMSKLNHLTAVMFNSNLALFGW